MSTLEHAFDLEGAAESVRRYAEHIRSAPRPDVEGASAEAGVVSLYAGVWGGGLIFHGKHAALGVTLNFPGYDGYTFSGQGLISGIGLVAGVGGGLAGFSIDPMQLPQKKIWCSLLVTTGPVLNAHFFDGWQVVGTMSGIIGGAGVGGFGTGYITFTHTP